MDFRVKKEFPCHLEVWYGCDVILDKSDLYFSNRKSVYSYMDEHLSKYKGRDLEYYITQYNNGKVITDIHLSYKIKELFTDKPCQ